VRNAITGFFRICLQIFFRRIEVVGRERVPASGPVVFAVNHPNGLVDPLFLLCFAGRPVSFLAKAPLLQYPFIGWIARTFETIPVYRKQDQSAAPEDLKRANQEMFDRARAVLRGGGSIAIFPEGTTHDDPHLRELKTGAARIALGTGLGETVVIPTGIYYTAKHVFRSEALVLIGEPLHVVSEKVEEPDAAAVEALTEAIDAGIDAVTLQADSHAALDLIARAEEIFTADDESPLAEEFALRRRFVEGYHYLRARDPKRLRRLQQAIARFAAELGRAGLDVHDLKPRLSLGRLFRVLVLLPIALVGAMVNYPAYLLIGMLAKRFSKGESAVRATIKFLGALAFYPLTYVILAIAIGIRFGWAAGVATGVLLPLVAYVALRVFEDIDDIIGDIRGLLYPRAHLVAQRRAILAEFVAVAKEMDA
jgi:glycerol-3-phosphate O-acyltransferase / dihydroxyacetone phosphate acyltransferase